MYVRLLNLVLALGSVLTTTAQAIDFSFSPGGEYVGSVDPDMYTEHLVYVYHDAQDTLDITWRVIENTCPEGWDFQMCDWSHCYDGFPNTSEMDPVAPGNSGYLKLLVNPYDIGGSGLVHFWVYPTGNIENREDVYFYLNGAPVSVGLSAVESEHWSIGRDDIRISQSTQGICRIIDLQGREIMNASCMGEELVVNTSAIPTGVYILITPASNRIVFLKP